MQYIQQAKLILQEFCFQSVKKNKIQLCFFTLPPLLIVAFLNTQEPMPDIDTASICKHIKALSSDEFEGRRSGTHGEQKTIRYIEQQFQAMGVAPGNGNSYLQRIELAYFSSISPQRINISGESGTMELRHQQDYFLASTKLQERIEVDSPQFVFAGFGIHAPEINWDDYAGLDVKDKIVIVLADTPDVYSKDDQLWKGDPGANLYGKNFYKRKEAASRGAKGLFIIFREQGPGYFNWNMLAGVYAQANLQIKTPVADQQLAFAGYLNRGAAKKLFEFAGLKNYNYQQAALAPRFKGKTLNISTHFTFSNTWADLTTHNVVGLIPGTDRADEVILYTAHWDHVGIGPPIAGDSIRNGAVDNASGTAGLLEIARAYKKLKIPSKRSILFIATGAEELGLFGATWYAANPLFPIHKTVASFNMDAHYPYGKTTHVLGVVYGRSELDTYLDKSAKRQGRAIVPNTEANIKQNIFFRSDHFPLVEVGIPSEFAVGAGNAMDHDSLVWQQKMAAYPSKYHQPTDEYEADFDCGGIAQDAELIFHAGYALGMSKHFPAWHTDQPFYRIRKKSQQP